MYSLFLCSRREEREGDVVGGYVPRTNGIELEKEKVQKCKIKVLHCESLGWMEDFKIDRQTGR